MSPTAPRAPEDSMEAAWSMIILATWAWMGSSQRNGERSLALKRPNPLSRDADLSVALLPGTFDKPGDLNEAIADGAAQVCLDLSSYRHRQLSRIRHSRREAICAL